MKRILSFLVLLVIVVLVASAGSLLTRYYIDQKTPPAKTEVFAQLNLTPEQEQKINAIRTQFANQQQQCMQLMQQRNRELAEVILTEQANSPRVQAAVERVHEAMGDMQKATLTSIFAAKEILTPEQYDKLLHLVATQLSTPETAPCCR
jgi:nickel and cobalt resistance protein CnrR